MTSSKQITVLVADDHMVVRQGLCSLLNIDGHFKIVGEARNGREAVKLAGALRPEVILMDIAMPELNGFEATRQILVADPKAKVVILSATSDDGQILRMCKAGVSGFLEKLGSIDVLAKAIRAVADGKAYFSPRIAKRLSDQQGKSQSPNDISKANTRPLTTREAEVLQLVAEGSANKRMASELGISIKTIEKHRQNLMDKLNIHDTAGLTRYAISSGVIDTSVRLTVI